MLTIKLCNFRKNKKFKKNRLMGQMNDLVFVSCRESRIENPRSLYGCFYLGPFSSEQSLTIANTIRRTLLSELKGLAITSVEIEGATHEYSTLQGVRDSVLDILLNLKDVILKSQLSFQKPQFSYIKVIGPGVIRAKDLKLPAFIQCVDPNQYIATLSENGVLNMKLTIEEGKNYLIQKPFNVQTGLNSQSKKILAKKLSNLKKDSTENIRTKVNLKEGVPLLFEQKKLVNKITYPLLIDPVFMPIQKVNYTIEIDHENNNYRSTFLNENHETLQPDKNTNLIKSDSSINHKIILEIWTNGSIHPRQALSYALKELVSIFLKLEKAKILNSFAFKSLLNNHSLINSIYFENLNYSEVLKKLNYKSNSLLNNLSSHKLNKMESKDIKNIKKKITLKVNIKNKIDNFSNEENKNQIYLRDIGTLNISLRPYTCLKRANINTIQELTNTSKKELLFLKNFGKKSLLEVEQSLIELGLELKN